VVIVHDGERASLREGVHVSVAIKYRHPLRPGEAGIILICDPSQAADVRESLERRGFVIIDDDRPPPSPEIDLRL
jgi:hypothetical protein